MRVANAAWILFAFSFTGRAQQLPPDCPSEDAKPSALLAYLKQDRAGLDARCIQTSAHTLGLARYKPAIPVLIDYLDVKEPGPPFLGKPGPTGGMFPAAEALAGFAGAAVPALKKAILDDNDRKLVRENAAATYIFISFFSLHEERPALEFVIKAARNASDSDAGKALMKVAEFWAKRCTAKEAKSCEDALKEQ